MTEPTSFKFSRITSAFIFAGGIVLAGYFISNSLLKARLHERYVIVKGLSEREVVADLAIWPIIIKATGNNLTEVNTKIEEDRDKVIKFLVEQGFKENEVEMGNYIVTDLLAQTYRNDTSQEFRYIINATIMIKTPEVELVKKVTQLQNLLVQSGVALGNNEYNGPFYEFTKFNDIKPEMLKEAIKNARKSAETFADVSGSKIGLLKNANQGMVVITPSDGGSNGTDEYTNAQEKRSLRKKIRVVTTLEYFLKE